MAFLFIRGGTPHFFQSHAQDSWLCSEHEGKELAFFDMEDEALICEDCLFEFSDLSLRGWGLVPNESLDTLLISSLFFLSVWHATIGFVSFSRKHSHHQCVFVDDAFEPIKSSSESKCATLFERIEGYAQDKESASRNVDFLCRQAENRRAEVAELLFFPFWLLSRVFVCCGAPCR